MNNSFQRKNQWLWPIKYLLMLLPFVMGYLGFRQLEGISPSWAAYYSIRLYGVNTDITEINGLIELARWTAPVATATALLLVLRGLFSRFMDWVHSFSKTSCSVYGDSAQAQCFLQALGKSGIRGDMDKPLGTPYHVVFSEDNQAALDFYDKNQQMFSIPAWSRRRPHSNFYQYRLFFNLHGILPMAIQQENITAFSVLWNCATVYWREHSATVGEKIALIGNGELCDALVEQGLSVNIFAPNQKIQYHIWNTDFRFEHLHTELEKAAGAAGDTVVFYHDNWAENTALISTFDRVILCAQEADNFRIAADFLALIPGSLIHLYLPSGFGLDFLADNHRMVCFGQNEKLLTRELILQEALLQQAKSAHERYRQKAADSEGRAVPAWEELSPFKRQSNVAATNYFPVLRQLEKQGKSTEELSELEHIRWCRFHYLYNWKFAEKRDDAMHLHPDLVPYTQLSEKIKQLDCDNVMQALNLIKKTEDSR